ncbi:rhamnose ABC transporter substrate-binding protein [Spirochaeta isovalerica]|uniref:Rhamnose transport system substrate-binding protein n=1 Tax=Spirochaeta isovalerica TaxID=150 RepID=A0A841RHI8_9SPIO|nr:rhamnose ABC transporter substrate-binding protein [Spirochaeta isovalerica]MBB6481998.1 rhamnose transport system substrate-binding protein [Spirochaeta isovalerica]
MKKILTLVLALSLTAGLMASGQQSEPKGDQPLKIVLLVKSLGNGFFEAVADGGKEAAAELGNVESIYQGPSTATAEGQIDIIESLIAQKVDGIAISANDRDALIPVTKKAMAAGIKVISFDSGIAPAGRIVDLIPSDAELIGRQQVQLIAELTGYKGQIGILSATSQATNQNLWIEWMFEEIKDPKYKDMEIVEVVYGDDAADKSYREAVGLMQKYPGLAGIISPTTVGVLAASKAIEDEGMKGKVQITGLGLPSEMQHYVENGTCGQMALWNPVDLGYTSTMILEALITGKVDGNVGDKISVGRMGTVTVGKDGVSIMGTPFVFNKDNIATYAAMF